ncbi:hypothetical protein ACQ86N_34675 [Puia sp. P3]|uniref:hypothetical protein n=1 Tax=Puia sp. P3 TaxID=3423952 RepID=UPI003D67FAF7
MLDIVKIEWLKLRYYSAFWWILGITALTYPGLNAIMLAIYHKAFSTMKTPEEKGKLMIGNPFGFNEVWHTVGYFSSWFVFVPAILVIMLITNEYTFKTHRQNVIDGWRRRDFIMGKLLDVGFVAGLITLIYIAACVTIGLENTAAGDQRGRAGLCMLVIFCCRRSLSSLLPF